MGLSVSHNELGGGHLRGGGQTHTKGRSASHD